MDEDEMKQLRKHRIITETICSICGVGVLLGFCLLGLLFATYIGNELIKYF